MNFKKWLNAENRAPINFKNAVAIVEGSIKAYIEKNKHIKIVGWLDEKLIPTHIKEQVYIRAVLAKECLQLGSCKDCGCCMKDKIFTSYACSKFYRNQPYCYGVFLNKKDWAKIPTTPELLKEGIEILKNANHC